MAMDAAAVFTEIFMRLFFFFYKNVSGKWKNQLAA
tara:strand:+ start:17468 stop:17572 length:105 start_codon:yes stop_codon:yes gene_type:complete